jgi:hypothetical protein
VTSEEAEQVFFGGGDHQLPLLGTTDVAQKCELAMNILTLNGIEEIARSRRIPVEHQRVM